MSSGKHFHNVLCLSEAKGMDIKIITALSVGLSIIAVLFLAMAREPYAITVMFLLLFIKSGLLYKQAKAGQCDIQ